MDLEQLFSKKPICDRALRSPVPRHSRVVSLPVAVYRLTSRPTSAWSFLLAWTWQIFHSKLHEDETWHWARLPDVKFYSQTNKPEEKVKNVSWLPSCCDRMFVHWKIELGDNGSNLKYKILQTVTIFKIWLYISRSLWNNSQQWKKRAMHINKLFGWA